MVMIVHIERHRILLPRCLIVFYSLYFIYSYIINPCVSLCIVTTGVTLTVNSVQAASRHTGGST